MNEICARYDYLPDLEEINRSLSRLTGEIDSLMTPEMLKTCFSLMDLTTLKATDTVASVRALVEKVNGLKAAFPAYPLPASVCVYPNFAATVAAVRADPALHVTTVAGCFPSSQSFLSVKMAECVAAVEDGADEIDIVLALNAFLAEDYAAAGEEIAAMRRCIDETAARLGRRVVLKVILETGLLVTPERIAAASFLAMENGADFIKTSTGKVEVNATPVAAWVMCECIRRFCDKTGRKVGFKAAGGLSTAEDAACYYGIVATLLGPAWLTKELFRFGVSRLGNSLISAAEQQTVSYF